MVHFELSSFRLSNRDQINRFRVFAFVPLPELNGIRPLVCVNRVTVSGNRVTSGPLMVFL
jgi:hypothetical protein